MCLFSRCNYDYRLLGVLHNQHHVSIGVLGKIPPDSTAPIHLGMSSSLVVRNARSLHRVVGCFGGSELMARG